jgi:hypothetical protein
MNNTHNRQQVVRFFQVIGLIIALFFERAVGLPILFLGISLQSIDLAEGAIKKVIFITSSVLLALVFQLSFLVSFLLISLGVACWFVFRQFSSSKTAILVSSVLVMATVLGLYIQVDFHLRTFLYSFISVLLLVGLTRTGKIR